MDHFVLNEELGGNIGQVFHIGHKVGAARDLTSLDVTFLMENLLSSTILSVCVCVSTPHGYYSTREILIDDLVGICS